MTKQYSVFVVELAPTTDGALVRRCVYVGLTNTTIDKAVGRVVLRRGFNLFVDFVMALAHGCTSVRISQLPEWYEHLSPMAYPHAVREKHEVIGRCSEAGYVVLSN